MNTSFQIPCKVVSTIKGNTWDDFNQCEFLRVYRFHKCIIKGASFSNPFIQWIKENEYSAPIIDEIQLTEDSFIFTILFGNETEAVHFKMYWL